MDTSSAVFTGSQSNRKPFGHSLCPSFVAAATPVLKPEEYKMDEEELVLIPFVADCLFLIRDDVTGCILFIGALIP